MMLRYFDITLFDVPHLMQCYFNLRLFNNALAAVALLSVRLVIVARFNVTVF